MSQQYRLQTVSLRRANIHLNIRWSTCMIYSTTEAYKPTSFFSVITTQHVYLSTTLPLPYLQLVVHSFETVTSQLSQSRSEIWIYFTFNLTCSSITGMGILIYIMIENIWKDYWKIPVWIKSVCLIGNLFLQQLFNIHCTCQIVYIQFSYQFRTNFIFSSSDV